MFGILRNCYQVPECIRAMKKRRNVNKEMRSLLYKPKCIDAYFSDAYILCSKAKKYVDLILLIRFRIIICSSISCTYSGLAFETRKDIFQ